MYIIFDSRVPVRRYAIVAFATCHAQTCQWSIFSTLFARGQQRCGLPVYYSNLLVLPARKVCGAGFMKRHGVRPSVPAWAYSCRPAAAGLLLWARRAGDIDRLLQQRRAAGECGQCPVVSVCSG